MKKLFLIAMFFMSTAQAVDFEISAGHSVFTPSDNGVWWQQGLEHHIETASNSVSLGLTDKVDSLRWRTGYMHLGEVNTWAIATSDRDFSGTGCISNPCEYYDTYIGTGSVQGFYASVAPEYQIDRAIIYVEAGLWAYQAKFNMTVIGLNRDGTGHNHVWHRRDKNEDYQVRPFFSIGVDLDGTQLVASAWAVDSSNEHIDTIPNYKGYTYNISLRKRF